LTLPALQLLLDEARGRQQRALGRAKQAKAWGVVDVTRFW